MSGFTLIASLDTPTSGAFTFTSLSLGSYSILRIVCSGITVTTDGTDISMTLYVGGVEQTGASDYGWGFNGVLTTNSTNIDGIASAANILLTSNDAGWNVGNAAGKAFGSSVYIDRPLSTAFHKRVTYHSWFTTTAVNAASGRGIGVLKKTAAIDGVKIGGSSNLTAGKVRILGL
jgi:hypothetical protein